MPQHLHVVVFTSPPYFCCSCPMLTLLPDDVKTYLVPFCSPILSGVNKDYRQRYLKYAKEALEHSYPSFNIRCNFPRALYQLDNLRLGLRVYEFDAKNVSVRDINVMGNSTQSMMFPGTFERCMCFTNKHLSWISLFNAPEFFITSTHDRICNDQSCILMDYRNELRYVVLDLYTHQWREFYILLYDINYVAIIDIGEEEIKIVYWKNSRSYVMWINFHTNETRTPVDDDFVSIDALLMNANEYFISFKMNHSIIPAEINWIKRLDTETWHDVAVQTHKSDFFQCFKIGDFIFFFSDHHCELQCLHRGKWRPPLDLPLQLDWHNWSIMGTNIVAWNVWPEFTEIIQYEIISPGMT